MTASGLKSLCLILATSSREGASHCFHSIHHMMHGDHLQKSEQWFCYLIGDLNWTKKMVTRALSNVTEWVGYQTSCLVKPLSSQEERSAASIVDWVHICFTL